MTDASYDVLFTGEIRPGTDREYVRDRIQGLFNLPGKTVDRLFSGHPVALKRGVDKATAERFREVFLKAGALVQVVPSGETGRNEHQTPSARHTPMADGTAAEAGSPVPESGAALQLAPATDLPLETPAAAVPPPVDISHLALVQGQHWTLADCAPQVPAIRMPDTRHLSLIEPELGQRQSGSESD